MPPMPPVSGPATATAADSGVPWDGKRPAGIGEGPEVWAPPPGSVSAPFQPLAGGWKTWVLKSGDELRSTLDKPPAFA